MNRVKAVQFQHNLSTRDCWDAYAPHRSIVTELLVQASHSDDGSICVLGCGNCNDLDLQRLVGSFSEIHLVDLDIHAMSAGVERQLPHQQSKCRQHDRDITGVIHLLAEWSPSNQPTDEELDGCLQRLTQRPSLELPDSVHVVASVCVLTQLFDSVVRTLGESHPRFVEFITAIRAQHVQLMLNLLRPGGTGVLITDVVASTTLPELLTMPDTDLAHSIARAVSERNFFTGTNPAVVESLFRTQPEIASRLSRVRVSLPWRWQLLNKVHAVYAVEVTKNQ